MTAAVARVVFDTNILVSGHFWKGPPYRCLLAAEARLAVLVLSDPIVAELREKLTGKFGLSTVEVDAIIERLSSHAERVHVQERSGWVRQDPDDDKFIDAALSSGATIVVSGDRHLLALGSVEGIEILTARQFLDRLGGRHSRSTSGPGVISACGVSGIPTLRLTILREQWRASRLPSSVGASRP